MRPNGRENVASGARRMPVDAATAAPRTLPSAGTISPTRTEGSPMNDPTDAATATASGTFPDTAPDTPGRIVAAFLAALETRDPAAKAFLAPGVRIVFPGGREFDSLETLAAWATTRYRWVRKTFERIEELPVHADGVTTVYCYGTLAGEWLDGRPFDGIRFIDRFEIDEQGRIVDQKVWNDLGEARR
jgi:hypothetical protein